MRTYDCIIIGGGPSGLTAGNILSHTKKDFLILEKGNYQYIRRRNNPPDIVSGIGGGGLYSDGKLSFHPSGSSLYKLNSRLLRIAYKNLVDLFKLFDLKVPGYDLAWEKLNSVETKPTELKLKQYDSLLLSDEELYKLGFYLYDKIGKDKFKILTDVIQVQESNNVFEINAIDKASGESTTYKAKNIIFGGGKFGSMNFTSIFSTNVLVFKKFEFGIRIETDHDNFDFGHYKQTDLKLIMPATDYDGIEYRTFCFCKNGYIVHGKFEDLSSFNGVSNRLGYKKTNFGINVRISDEDLFLKLKPNIDVLKKRDSIVQKNIKLFLREPLKDWSSELQRIFSDCLETNFPKLCNSNALVTGPSFEYTGYYPLLDDKLQIPQKKLWVMGDATGDFRGLLPGLVSGYIAGLSFAEGEINNYLQ